ncbi:MAG: hypothetical protein VW546_06260, partial [Gammaproteobacteria bacterium]
VTELKTDPGDLLLVGHQVVNMALKAELSGCFEPRCLEQFRQANDEMDMWSIVPARSIKRLKAE